MLATFNTHLAKNLPEFKNAKIIVAISGGVDSTVLADLLHNLKYNIALAHCNFKLRGVESDKDELFVKKLAEKYQVSFFSKSFDTGSYASENNLSTQMAARALRYHWFQELLDEYQYDFIATAHHQDDALETFIINLSRGTGLEGLCGIPEVNGNIIRPLLPFSREEILAYANKEQLQWREDQSNASVKYQRNKIRHEIVPLLKSLNPSFLSSFKKTLAHLNNSMEFIDFQVEELSEKITNRVGEELHLKVIEILSLKSPKTFLFQFLKPYHFTQWDDIFELLNSQTGKKIWSGTHQLLKNREHLVLSKLNKAELSEFLIHEGVKEISNPINLHLETLLCKKDSDGEAFFLAEKENNHIEFVDKSKLSFPLKLRKHKDGDLFYPIGMKGNKKISKYLKDQKLSLNQKQEVWLLVSASDEIIWVLGMRLDRRFSSTSETKKLLKMTFQA